ncbi:ferredoxin [Plantactinospora mayteni]|uniref:Ferredoxin n=1 Tax=Plantactinospora mayteni TaxID=566021 RepID=A0ABQ4EXX3_9ACTN|nr:ferredoxin [Plantactinospora mayteni]GIG99512.1 ferredoxin [Plantactinospora mayteni]
MRITADLDRCVGAGQCVLTDPVVFDQRDDDGTVIILSTTPEDAETIGRVREAIRICPSQALALAEPGTTS